MGQTMEGKACRFALRFPYILLVTIMGINDGHANEQEIIELLNGKRISDLAPHFKKWLTTLFLKCNDYLEVKKLNNEQKADIAISRGDQSRYISIKSGDSNSFHSESIRTFIPFLRGLGVSESTLKVIAFFHFGDNTLTGLGPTRFTSAELRRVHAKAFKSASEELSQPQLMKEIINRVIIQGRYGVNYPIDGIYHGTIKDGFFLSTKQIYRILLRKSHQRKNGTINIGMLTYQPGSRNLWGIPGSEQKREQSEIRWRSFLKDAKSQLLFDKEEN